MALLITCHLTGAYLPNAHAHGAPAADIATQIHDYKAQLALYETDATDATQTDIRLRLAKAYLQIEAYTEATETFHQIITALEMAPRKGTPENNAENNVRSEVYYGLGLAYAGREQFTEAVEAYQRAIAVAPDRPYAHAALAGAYVNMHRYTEALQSYKTATALAPDDAMIHHQLGNVYDKRGERTEARQHQQRAVSIDPEFAAAHYRLGLLYAQEKRWADAIAAYETAYEHDETLVEALYNLAQASRRNGDAAAAREHIQRFETQKAAMRPIQQLRGALQRTQETSERARILTNIGRLYIKNRLYERAVSEYRKAIGMDSTLASAYNGLGIAYTMLQRYPDALAAQQKSVALQPDFPQAHAGIGLVYLRKNDPETALTHYRHAVTLDPQFLAAHLKIGMLLLELKRYTAASDAYRVILKLTPDNPEGYHNLGLSYAYQARAMHRRDASAAEAMTASALAALEKAIALSDASNTSKTSNTGDTENVPIRADFLTETYYLIGDIRAAQGDFTAARAAYLAAGTPKAYHALARYIATATPENSDLKTARHYAVEAVRLDPNTPSYYNTLARIEFQRGDYRQAENAIRKALALEPENRNYQHGLKQIAAKLQTD